MTPFRFGPHGRKLYGVFHPGELKLRPSVGVLLCNPYGQEAIRTHRLFRLLAERLSRDGLHVLRFDYFATGESDGDDVEGEMVGWANDVGVAHAELLARSRCEKSVWVGARLGGTLAIQATAATTPVPDSLILWEAIVDGRAYAAELGRMNAQALMDPLHGAVNCQAVPLQNEATGFAVGAELRSQFDMLSTLSITGAQAKHAAVMAPPGDPAARTLAATLRASGCQVNEVPFLHELVWGDEEAMNSALAPSDVVDALRTRVAAATE